MSWDLNSEGRGAWFWGFEHRQPLRFTLGPGGLGFRASQAACGGNGGIAARGRGGVASAVFRIFGVFQPELARTWNREVPGASLLAQLGAKALKAAAPLRNPGTRTLKSLTL